MTLTRLPPLSLISQDTGVEVPSEPWVIAAVTLIMLPGWAGSGTVSWQVAGDWPLVIRQPVMLTRLLQAVVAPIEITEFASVGAPALGVWTHPSPHAALVKPKAIAKTTVKYIRFSCMITSPKSNYG
jgi:hypothetical protein